MIIRNDRKKIVLPWCTLSVLQNLDILVHLLLCWETLVVVWPQRLDNFLSVNFHLHIQTNVQVLWPLIKYGL